MEELRDLAWLIKNHSQRSLKLLNQNFRKKEKSKDNLLFELIAGKNISDDETAARALLKTDPANRNYRNAKSKLRQKLMNHLFFLDYDRNSYTQFQKVQYDCILKLSQFKILVLQGKSWMVLKRLPVLVKTAIDFDLVEIALEGLLILRNEYAKMGKYNPHNEAELELRNFMPLHKTIIECEEMFYSTLVMINKSHNSCEKIIDTLPSRVKFIENEALRLKNRRIDILSKMLSVFYYRVCHKNERILEICNYLEDTYIKEDYNKINVNIDVPLITSIKMDAIYRMNITFNVEPYCRKKIGLFKEGTTHWIAFMEYRFLLLLKSKKYIEAASIYKAVKSVPHFTTLDWDTTERWMIYKAYLCFMTDCKSIQWGFNSNKFIVMSREYPKQYLNYFIAILIARLLFLLRDGNIAGVKETILELQKYSSPHLDKRYNYRNSIFVRMLEVMMEKNFEINEVVEKTTIYYQKLLENHTVTDRALELEVIPYETLWEHITQILKSNKHFVHYRFYHFNEV